MDAVSPPDAYVLAGGRSTRMGAEKALLELDGRSFIERIVNAIRPVAGSVTLIGGDLSLDDLETVPDQRGGFGPLAGIETALSRCTTDRALIVACDLPFVSTALLELLLDRSAAQPQAAVVPMDAEGRVAPLCAVYPQSALPLVSELLDRGERKPRALLIRIPTDLVPFAEYSHLDSAADLLCNVNTPTDLSDAVRIARVPPAR